MLLSSVDISELSVDISSHNAIYKLNFFKKKSQSTFILFLLKINKKISKRERGNNATYNYQIYQIFR